MRATTTSTGVAFYAGTKGNSTATITSNEFYVRGDGYLKATNAKITGTITADTGKIGGSSGFTIASGKIYSGSKSTSTANSSGVYIGTDAIALGTNNKFIVNNSGYLISTSGSIAGWDISDASIYKHDSANTYYVGMQRPNSSGTVVFYAGTSTTNPEFYVRADGLIRATKLEIQKQAGTTAYKVGINTGTASTDVAFYAGNQSTLTNNPFYVRYNGYMKASSGSIGGWTIGSSGLTNGSGNNQVALYPKSGSSANEAVILIGNSNAATAVANANTKFKVSSDGSVYFQGDIYGYSSYGFKKGVSNAQIILPTSTGSLRVEICRGLIIDIST